MVKKVDKDVGKKIRRIPKFSFVVYNKTQVRNKLGSKALKFIKKNKLEVGELPQHLQKRGFVGYRQTGTSIGGKRKTTIFLDKKLKTKERKKTFWHEAGHHKVKKALTPLIRNALEKETKKLQLFKLLRKQGYTKKQVPEEILVEKFATHQTERKVKISKSFPIFRKQFNNLVKRVN